MADRNPDEQRQLALDVLRRLREAGFQAPWAGGCVRDQLLGARPTTLTWPPMPRLQRFAKSLGIAIRSKSAPPLAWWPSRDARGPGMVEVTTFRQDAEYSDGRHPDKVVFSTPEDDAQRRDFTINGLFFDPLTGQVIDFVGGQADLERGLVSPSATPGPASPKTSCGWSGLCESRPASVSRSMPTPRPRSRRWLARSRSLARNASPRKLRKMLVHERRADAVEHLRHTRLLAMLAPELLAVAQRWRRAGICRASRRRPALATHVVGIAGPE